jgi:hypothetical protein
MQLKDLVEGRVKRKRPDIKAFLDRARGVFSISKPSRRMLAPSPLMVKMAQRRVRKAAMKLLWG